MDENILMETPKIPFKGDIVCKRNGPRLEGTLEINIPQRIVKHSPTGMEIGYGGSGPADFALNILALFIGRRRAERVGLYQDFKWKFIATMDDMGGTIKNTDIVAWLKKHGENI